MTTSEDDEEPNMIEVLSDFIKGKAGPTGATMAKLSWEGKTPPKLPPLPKKSERYSEFAAEYPALVASISRCTRRHTLTLIGSMLTLPEFQANCYRLEVLAHLAVLYANGKTRPTSALLTAWFNMLEVGTCGRQEDPAEDVFLSNVFFGPKNYRLFEGTAEGNAFYTQIFLQVVEKMPQLPAYSTLKTSIHALLALSEEVARRGGLQRNIVGNAQPRGEIQKPNDDAFRELSQRVVFSTDDLAAMGIDLDILAPFIITEAEIAHIPTHYPGFTPLEFKPLVQVGDRVIVTLPTTIGIAIRAMIIEGSRQRSLSKALEKSISGAYASLLTRERLLGTLRVPQFQMIDHGPFQAAQLTVEIDTGRYLHLLFFVDTISDFMNGAFAGMNQIDPISQFVQYSISEISPGLCSKSGFREAVTLIVGCGWGRGIGIGLSPTPPNWRIEFMSAHDLISMSHYPKFQLLDFLRILDAEEAIKVMGITLVNANGLLNLYGWMLDNNGHIVPHEKLDADFISSEHGAFIQITQNSIVHVRHTAANAVDLHLTERPDGSPGLVRRVKGTPAYGTTSLSPFYADTEALNNRVLHSVYEGKQCLYWVEAQVPAGLGRGMKYHLSNMVMSWGEAVFRYVDARELGQGRRLFSCIVNFGDSVMPTHTDGATDTTEIERLVEFDIDPHTSKAVINVKPGYLLAARRPDNAAERALVKTLINATLGGASPAISDNLLQEVLDGVVSDEGARHFHVFSDPGIRDYVRDSLPEEQTIETMDDTNSRLGLGWLVRDRSLGSDLSERTAACRYLNELVRAVAERLRRKIAQFDRTSLVSSLIANHEALYDQANRWERTFKAVRSLSDDPELVKEEAGEKLAEIHAAALASRICAEIAVCESPMNNGHLPGRYDIGGMLADASQIFHLGGYSDAVNAEVMEASIRISPAGDVLMDHSFTDDVMLPFGRKFQSTALDRAAANYAGHYSRPAVEEGPAEVFHDSTGLEKYFEVAWEEEFGFAIDELRAFVEGFQRLAIERKEAVILIPRADLLSVLAELSGLDPSVAQKCLSQFTLLHRPVWDKAPKGFLNTAWHPWRFRRMLSIISKPIIQLEASDNGVCVVAPAMVVIHAAKFVSDVRFGAFDEQAFRKGGPLERWIGDINRRQGEAFNQKVADRFVELGWSAKANLSDGAILDRQSDDRFGDVDVLAWSASNKRVVLVECKDLSFDKTLGEVSRRLLRYRGVESADGKRDDLKRHLDRYEVLKGATSELSVFVDFEVKTIEPLLVFSQPTPMQYHATATKSGIEMTAYREIEEWLSVTSH